MYWSCGPRGNVDGARRRSFSGEADARLHDAGAGVRAVQERRTTLEIAALALSAATTCAAVLVTTPFASVAGLMRIALPVRLTLSGLVGGAAPGRRSAP